MTTPVYIHNLFKWLIVSGILICPYLNVDAQILTKPGDTHSGTYSLSPTTSKVYALSAVVGLCNFSESNAAIGLQASLGADYSLLPWLSLGASTGISLAAYNGAKAAQTVASDLGADTLRNATGQFIASFNVLVGPKFMTTIRNINWHISPKVGFAGISTIGGGEAAMVTKNQLLYKAQLSTKTQLAWSISVGFDRPLTTNWKWGLELQYLRVEGSRYGFINHVPVAGSYSQEVDGPFASQIVQLGIKLTYHGTH